MKNIFLAIILFTLTIACTDLDVTNDSEISSDNFPSTEDDFEQLCGAAYTYLSNSGLAQYYWFLQELSADGMILPAEGGNWYDDGIYEELHLHTWTKDNSIIQHVWDWGFGGISACNEILGSLEDASEAISTKSNLTAEITVLRSYFYYAMMDLFGGLPIVESSNDEVSTRSTRTETFNFIEKSILNVIDDLDTEVSSSTYGTPTKWMAYALLAKMYLNSEIYTGEERYNDAIAACDSIITEAETNGSFSLNDAYADVFNVDNGPDISEIIFAAPFDCDYITGMSYARYWIHPYQYYYFGLSYYPSGCVRGLPEFYDLYTDTADERRNVWLTGLQYYSDGTTPYTWETTYGAVNNACSEDSANLPITYQLEYTREVIFEDEDNFDIGDDFQSEGMGYRCNKYYPDNASSTKYQSNDVVIFRYADILLMKAEAILRGGTQTLGQTPLDLVNTVRERSNASDLSSVTLDTIIDERGRELCFENWRRNDLIRFNMFEDEWGIKTDDNEYKRIYPVPANEMTLYPDFEQNNGYN